MQNNINFPKYLSIQTTSLCNASCIFCPYQDIKGLFPTKIMDMNLYKKIINECANYKNIERIILYMNNEPLTDPYLIERINYAKEKVPWAGVHILTNGLLLTEEMGDKLLDSKLDWLGISFHGIRKDTIEKAMGIPFKIAFERINKFIEKAKRVKNIGEYIMITFLRHNFLTLEEKEEAISYWRNKGIKRVSYFDGPISRAGNVKTLPKVYHREKIVGCNSIWADEMIHIVEEGKVVLCCMDWRREVILGDLNKESIYSVWNGERKRTWELIMGKKDMSDNFLCRRCEEAVLEKEQIDANNEIVLKGTRGYQFGNGDILFVNLPPWGIESPPLGTACLSSYLKSKGFKTKVFDLNIKLYNKVPKEDKYLWSMNYSYSWRQKEDFLKIHEKLQPYLNSFIEEIAKSSSKVLGFSLPTNCSDLILKEIVKRVKDTDSSKIIILGGVSISIKEQRQDLLKEIKDYVDYCIVGEGEDVLYKLMSSIVYGKNKKEKDIKGVLNKETFFNDTDPVYVEDLDKLPFPSFDEYDLYEYEVPNSVIMEFSRGCIGNCPFCDFKSISPLFRSKSAFYIFNQIKFYKEKYNINHISVCDAAVNGNMKVLEDVCDLLIKNNLIINISALAIPRKEMTENLLKKMRKVGFYRLEYGVESGSNKILKAMRKIFTKEIAEKVVRDTYTAGIKTYLYFIVGYPGETEDDFNETKEFLKRNAQYITMIKSINPLYIMAGSEIFYNHQKYNIVFPFKDGDRRWHIENENTYSLRKKRVLDLKTLADSLGIPFTEEAESLEFIMDVNRLSEEIIEVEEAGKKKGDDGDFLLINLPPWAQENPHIGIGYLCSYLRAKGLKPKVIDLNKRFCLNHPDFKLLWHVENKNFWSNEKTFPLICEIFKKDIEEAIEEILGFNCSVLGFSVVDPKERLTIEFIKRIKQKAPNKKIILGGPATSTYEQRKIFLDNIPELIDAFVIGEGEETLACLLDRILNKKEILDVEGCYVRNNGKWVYKERLPINLLDKIPFPTYEEFDLNLYGKSLLVEWSRGCRGRCAFCKNYRLFSNFRVKSPDWILRELRYHKQKYGIEEFTVVDNILNGDLKNLNEVCNRIIKENLKIRWTGQIAPCKNMDYDFFKKMLEAGCFKLQIGLESGSDKVLRLMRKPFTSEISERNIRDAKKAGIETEIFIMIGFPGETEEDFKRTCDFVKRNAKFIDTIKSINTLHLIAGTEVYEKATTKFNMKPLPKENWHYLWETYDGNTYKVRKRRAQKLLDLTYKLGIKVMEINIMEGKENIFDIIKKKKQLEERLTILKGSISTLQELPQKRKIVKKKRSIFKWLILIFISFYVFFYIIYFWIYAKIKGKILLGGK